MDHVGNGRELTYARIVVGETYARRTYSITSELIRAYSRLVRAPTRTVPTGPDARPILIAPPTLPAMWTPPRICFNDWNVPPGGIHTLERWRCYGIIVAGTTLDMTVTAVDKHVRRDRNHVIFEAIFRGPESILAEGSMGVIWPI